VSILGEGYFTVPNECVVCSLAALQVLWKRIGIAYRRLSTGVKVFQTFFESFDIAFHGCDCSVHGYVAEAGGRLT